MDGCPDLLDASAMSTLYNLLLDLLGLVHSAKRSLLGGLSLTSGLLLDGFLGDRLLSLGLLTLA